LLDVGFSTFLSLYSISCISNALCIAENYIYFMRSIAIIEGRHSQPDNKQKLASLLQNGHFAIPCQRHKSRKTNRPIALTSTTEPLAARPPLTAIGGSLAEARKEPFLVSKAEKDQS
jgi:hypothetical protein